jgi:hypothetical protein
LDDGDREEARGVADVTGEFFEEVGRRGPDPWLANVKGTLRLEVVDGKRTERWFVSVDRGKLSVSRRNAKADCVVRASRALSERLVRGEENALASFLRGSMAIEGNPELLVAFQRLFPGPPRQRKRRRAAATTRRQA